MGQGLSSEQQQMAQLGMLGRFHDMGGENPFSFGLGGTAGGNPGSRTGSGAGNERFSAQLHQQQLQQDQHHHQLQQQHKKLKHMMLTSQEMAALSPVGSGHGGRNPNGVGGIFDREPQAALPRQHQQQVVVSSPMRKFDGKWGERLEQLRAYKDTHGDCLVPDGYSANPKLARWVREQRGQFKNLRDGKPSHMTQERMAALNELNFTWSLREKVDWKDRFEELVDYKCKHGDCLVPTNYAPNAQLGTWVANQRKHYRLMREGKRSIMTQERIVLLERAGFQWSIRPSGSRRSKAKRPAEDSP